MTDHEVFEAGDVTLGSGAVLADVKLAYNTYGEFASDKRNAVLCLMHFSGRPGDNTYLFGEDKAIDPRRYFIIAPYHLANGVSSSPSNTPPPADRPCFPLVTVYDNAALQHRLVAELFGIERIVLALGFSMGALQAYHWAAGYPDTIERVAPICGSARTSPHNHAFLDGMNGVVIADRHVGRGTTRARR